MRMPSKETVEALRRAYPVGCAVELEQMDDWSDLDELW